MKKTTLSENSFSSALSRVTLLAGVASVVPGAAQASVIYSGLQSITRTVTSAADQSYSVFLAGDGNAPYTFTAHQGIPIGVQVNSVVVGAGTNGFVGTGILPSALLQGAMIGNSSSFLTGNGTLLAKTSTGPAGNWSTVGDSNYLGVKFHDPGAGSSPTDDYFGWVQVVVTVVAPNGPPVNSQTGFTIPDWAYENTGGQILAGATTTATPEPSSIALFALGAAGLAALRARRKSSSN